MQQYSIQGRSAQKVQEFEELGGDQWGGTSETVTQNGLVLPSQTYIITYAGR